ncbi:chemotaxis protein CheA [Leptospira sp. severe_002]|uniref:chemotaxis protein CheA n=2 Tax=Pseudomonadati TaxID=3379134 RepID=UPI001E38F245|nr:chemotaxis protein CheA [Leptospira sp. severe_002]
MNLDQLKQTFFDECAEAMQNMEAGLTEAREGTGNDDTINGVFRAVHSVKGGAGIFGFEDLVNFAHVFETVLDALRAGKLAVTPEVIDVLLPAGDVLSDLVTMSRAGDPIPPNYGHEQKLALEAVIGGDGHAAAEEPIADFAGISFTPVMVSDEPADDNHTYSIVFRPKADMLKKANEPLFIIRDLRAMGELDLTAEIDRIPHLNELEYDHPYIGWTGSLKTKSPKSAVEEVFAFVADDCELSITEEAPFSQTVTAAEPKPSDGMEAMFAAAAANFNADTAPVMPVAETPAFATMPPAESAPAAAPAPAAAGGGAAAKNGGVTTTRVELEKIDRVVNMVGELVIAQAMLGQIVQGLPDSASGQLAQMLEEVVHHTRELKDSVMSMRAQPVSAVFQRMTRLVREVATKTGKKVKLEFEGENTEVDRSIIERLSDPLTHIIRNSIDHGIEAPAKRHEVGKHEEGTIRLRAEQRGSRIVIEVIDDGQGINHERVLKKAQEKGLVSADAQLSDDAINNLIFLPGFSTADQISDISGRGVGMDVVRRNIQDLGGRITLKSERGKGMTIQLALPLTLAVMDGMVIKLGRETYVLPMPVIVECLRPGADEIRNLIGTPGVLQLRGELLPLVPLGNMLNVTSTASDLSERVVIITENGEGTRFGLVVDELLGHQQVVIKSIEDSYGSVPGVAGATILGNGRVALILDVDRLSEMSAAQMAGAASYAAARDAQPAFAARN